MLAISFAIAGFSGSSGQGAENKIRVGWAISKTGSNSIAVATSLLPNYRMWVNDINAAGGLSLKNGRRALVEVVEYDDRSNSEEAVRAIERLITQDKVDIVLPPLGTALNLAVAPTLAKYGYPFLGVTATTDLAPELVKRWPNAFFFIGTGSQYGEGLLTLLEQERKSGELGNKVAMIYAADAFGVDLSMAARKLMARYGFDLVYDKSYPVGIRDMVPILSEIKDRAPDIFLCFSYPPDTLLVTDQAIIAGFNPKVFYTGVGTQYPAYRQRFGHNIDGVMGPGGIDADNSEIQRYFRRINETSGGDTDRFAAPVVYVGLQVLQQAIEHVGSIDRSAIIQDMKTAHFATIFGDVTLGDQQLAKRWLVGQWQDGEFKGIAPADVNGANKPVIPKPAWK
ncbi:twin-arginine translocation pathway signal protein [Bradyrhizobium sp. NAS80.1]|nr:twin-arginine translocation pathway signal protein [Bradyrhizobium sp. NAS80.1]